MKTSRDTDADAVWLGILGREQLAGTPAQIRRRLTRAGFPERLIAAHLSGTAEAILARLRGMVVADGNQACVARRLGVTPQYLSAVLAGKKGLGDKIPRALGYTEVVRYEETR